MFPLSLGLFWKALASLYERSIPASELTGLPDENESVSIMTTGKRLGALYQTLAGLRSRYPSIRLTLTPVFESFLDQQEHAARSGLRTLGNFGLNGERSATAALQRGAWRGAGPKLLAGVDQNTRPSDHP